MSHFTDGVASYFAGGVVNGTTGEILTRFGRDVAVFASISSMYLYLGSLRLLHLLVPRFARSDRGHVA